ncbi:MAG: hypothetical protein K8R88_02670, partial [Armatimonadetes bacterium]|nr:hypothetical protein [Armatimonadota bacterium]
RAREELTLTHARRRTVFGQPSFNKRSRFLDDIPVELLSTDYAESSNYALTAPIRTVSSDRTGKYTVNDKTSFDNEEKAPASTWKAPFLIGQKVQHSKFGIGVVISCSPVKEDCEVTVAFPGVVGMKKLLQSFAKLEAI